MSIRLRIASACAAIATVALAAGPVPAGAADSPPPQFNPPKWYYLALGDSVAFGYQSSKAAAGLPPSGFDTGYVDVLMPRLRTIRPGISVTNYGCPGETTTTFIEGACLSNEIGFPLHDPFAGTQLDAAIAFLKAHPGKVSPITLTLWGGDVRELVQSCDGDLGCISDRAPGAIGLLARNLHTILGELRAAAPDAEIIVTGAWDSFVGAFEDADPLFEALNAVMAGAVADERARFADPFPIFNPQGDPEAETAAICTLLLICSEGDSHPSDAGYRAIADLVLDASEYDRLRG
jgi:lysophospholipase L1-like esterase